MLVTCSNCSAKFQFDDGRVKSGGTRMRCARCHETFTVYPEKNGDGSEFDFLFARNPASKETETAEEILTEEDLVPDPAPEISPEEDDAGSKQAANNIETEPAPVDEKKTGGNPDPFDSGIPKDLPSSAPENKQGMDSHSDVPGTETSRPSGDAIASETAGDAVQNIPVPPSQAKEEKRSFAETRAKTAPERKKKRIIGPLFSLFFFLLLALFIYGSLAYLQKNKFIHLPIDLPVPAHVTGLPILNYFFPVQHIENTEGPGNLHIHTFSVELKFVDSKKLGRLLVLSGKVKNSYPQPRQHINLRAKLFVNTDIVRNRTAYAGNIISDENLSALSITDIESELNKPDGDKNSNSHVAPNGELPFMFVFADLPANLSGYDITVVSSEPVEQEPVSS